LVIQATSGLDYQLFFKRYIDGTQPLPVAGHFDLGKALWDFEFNPAKHDQHANLYLTLGITAVRANKGSY